MEKVNRQLKNQLDKELEQIQFTKQEEVLGRVYLKNWRQKLHSLWNKEISIPLVPVSAAFMLFIIAFGYVELKPAVPSDLDHGEKILVEVAGNYYWKDDFERALLKHEN